MNDTNDIRYTNDISYDNVIRYTNDDVPVNVWGAAKENEGVKEFGSDTIGKADEDSRSFDYQKHVHTAATFMVVAVVAMAVVMDDSPFSEIFSPITGIISESFGISVKDDGYAGECELSLIVTDTDITYWVYFTVDPGTDAYIRLDNNFEHYRVNLVDEESMNGCFDSLQKGVRYTVSVDVGKETVRSQSVTMLRVYDGEPVFGMFLHKCYCMEDGTFHIQFNITDRNAVWSDFGARLVFSDGTAAECDFTEDVTGLQTIIIPAERIGIDTEALLEVYCDERASDGSTSVKTLYSNLEKL